ncbi:MAG: hypothetical protein AAB944_02525 [Patescibacteria group bacterium]
MENFEPKNIPPEDAGGKENKNKEYKSNSTKLYEENAEKEKKLKN